MEIRSEPEKKDYKTRGNHLIKKSRARQAVQVGFGEAQNSRHGSQ